MPFQIIRNDITKVQADAIVNSANPHPTYGDGVDQAVYEAAGKRSLLAERQKIGEIARGQAAVTPALKLDAKYIIHTVGPVWQGGDQGEFDILRSCYENSLKLALELKCRSIAFPLIATGVYGFPKDKALQIAMSVIEPFLMHHAMKVILVVFDKKSFELSGRVAENVEAYVDENYVSAQRDWQYTRHLSDPAEEGNRRGNAPSNPAEEDYRQQRLRELEEFRGRKEHDRHGNLGQQDDLDLMGDISHQQGSQTSTAKAAKTVQPSKSAKPSVPAKKVKIDDLLSAPEKTFQEKMFELMDERGLTAPDVYGAGNLSKQVFSKMMCDKNYHPNKYTAIKFCLGLKLNIDETLDLLGRAGWTLSPSSKPDLVVKGCIINQEYNEVKIDLIMFDKCQTQLCKIK